MILLFGENRKGIEIPLRGMEFIPVYNNGGKGHY